MVEHEPRHDSQRARRLAAIRSRIWIDQTSNDVTLYGLTLDSSGFDAVAGQSGIAINGDRVALKRNLITNSYGAAGSCITNDADQGVADDTVISLNRIYDCGGRDPRPRHLHELDEPPDRERQLDLRERRPRHQPRPYTHDARITRNVIADNCANPLGGPNDCSANVIYWGFERSSDAFNNNTVAFPH